MSKGIRWASGLGAALVVCVIAGSALAGGAPAPGKTTIRVIEHATTDKVIDTGRRGDSTGDLLTFHNRVFNASDTRQVGRDQGDCVRISPKAGTYECRWTTFLPGGKITVEGPFFDTRNSTLAITGGTGRFRNADGAMMLEFRKGGTEFAFTFRLQN